MARSLSDRAQRLVFGVLVVVLVAFGIYLSLGGFSGGNGGSEEQGDESASNDNGAPATNPPSPIPTTATEDMEVIDWLPFSEDEAKAAAATAQGFAEAYRTIDYSGTPEEYYESLEELASEDYVESVEENSGAGALWQEMADEEAITEGRANVKSIRSFDDDSVVFVIETQSITESDEGTEEDRSDYAVTTVREDGEWRVFDFQPAKAGNLGEG